MAELVGSWCAASLQSWCAAQHGRCLGFRRWPMQEELSSGRQLSLSRCLQTRQSYVFNVNPAGWRNLRVSPRKARPHRPHRYSFAQTLASLWIRSGGIEPRHTMSEIQPALQDSATKTGPGLQTSNAKGQGESAAAIVTPCVVHLWSGPRCCSTSLMYSFAQVGLVGPWQGWSGPFLNVHGVAQPCREVVGRLLGKQLQEGDRPQYS